MIRALIPPIFRSTRLCVTAYGIMEQYNAGQYPGSGFPPLPGYRPATSWVPYTTSCKHYLALLKIGEIIARNMLSRLELLINRYYCIYLVVYIICIRVLQIQKLMAACTLACVSLCILNKFLKFLCKI